LQAGILSSVEGLEQQAEPLITRGCSKLALAREADSAIPPNPLLASHIATCVHFLVLSRIEYLLGFGTAAPRLFDNIFAEFISRFLETYLSYSEHEKQELCGSRICTRCATSTCIMAVFLYSCLRVSVHV
jgi:hypothetical protein